MDLFSILEHEHSEETERVSGSRALIAAKQRTSKRYHAFLSKAESEQEWNSRISLIETGLRQTIAESASDYGYETPAKLFDEVVASLKRACKECGCDCEGGKCSCDDCSSCKSKTAAPHKDGCSCGFCERMRSNQGGDSESEDDDEGEEKEASTKVAFDPTMMDMWGADPMGSPMGANPQQQGTCPNCHSPIGPDGRCPSCGFDPQGQHMMETPAPIDDMRPPHMASRDYLSEVTVRNGSAFDWDRVAADAPTEDSFSLERESLPSAGPSGLSETGSPKINTDRVPSKGLQPIDVPSSEHPLERQDIVEDSKGREPHPYLNTDRNKATEKRPKQVDADKPMQPELLHGSPTKTFPDKDQTDPVTRKTINSKWTVLD